MTSFVSSPRNGSRVFAWVIGCLGILVGTAGAAPLLPSGPLPAPAAPPSAGELEEGRVLAQKYCTACHLAVDPQILDRATWRTGTEPMMRRLMKFDALDSERPEDVAVAKEWRRIWDWYFANAPAQPIPPPAHPPLAVTLNRFAPEWWAHRRDQQMATLVKIDPGRRQVYVGNQVARTLDVLDAQGNALSSLTLASPPVGLVERPEGWYAPLIWDLSPHDTRQGQVVRLRRDGDRFVLGTNLLSELPRPTTLAAGDLNGDGREDFVVCGYGNVEGAVSWWEQTASGQWAEHRLLDRPGGVKAEIADLNRDGRPDIVVQMAQAREGLYWFENLGSGVFEARVIAEFHPAWGSSSFQLVDFDRDGDLDVLATNGDSGEYPSGLKAFHGVRWYRNDGKNQFSEAYFYPVNGAYGVRAADYDEDGDLDLAVISFFADYGRKNAESFVLLWNDGAGRFRPETLDAGASGRWIVMDAGDVDGDGDVDLVLGAANQVPFWAPKALTAAWAESGSTVLLLRNQTSTGNGR